MVDVPPSAGLDLTGLSFRRSTAVGRSTWRGGIDQSGGPAY